MKRALIIGIIATVVAVVSVIIVSLKEIEGLLDFSVDLGNSGYN